MQKVKKILKKLRKKIDDVDSALVKLLNKRAVISQQIGSVKRAKDIDIYAPDRESQVYQSVVGRNAGPLADDTIKAVYREIMSGTLALEGPLKVAYLGPPATFTHQASLHKFGSSVSYIDCNTITDVFREVDNGRATYGVVPIENSIEGAVNHTLDMFIDFDLKICSEVYLEISHNLLGRGGIKKIKAIYSNPQVFGQCRNWIEKNTPLVELVDVTSTTKAAEVASRKRNAAAIGSALAAEVYKLNVLAKDIEDSAHNVTRFLVISRKLYPKPTRNDRTSLVFSIKDRVGALHDMLVPFKRNAVNLTKIESRPSKERAWDYYFFVDLEGHINSEKVKRAILNLRKVCTYLKILGSYPVGR
jgi:chorismate mutase/prephenate dehydratase